MADLVFKSCWSFQNNKKKQQKKIHSFSTKKFYIKCACEKLCAYFNWNDAYLYFYLKTWRSKVKKILSSGFEPGSSI